VVIFLIDINQVEGWISRQAAGLCFDFMPNDSSTYIVGTEEGSIHRCSVSYNEQYLDNYESHEGPLSRIRFSSRWPNVFLTCSADWMIRLYHINSKQPLLTMRSAGEDFAVNDICWCPGNSTVTYSLHLAQTHFLYTHFIHSLSKLLRIRYLQR